MRDISEILGEQQEVPLNLLKDEQTAKAKVNLIVKREDLIHPLIAGNKWRKLKYNLAEATRLSKNTLITFGGAYSNHIHATAAAGDSFGFNTIGIIRGEATIPLNPTLQFARAKGMKLIFVSRTAYRDKELLLKELAYDPYRSYVLPEGGTNTLALKGAEEIITESNLDFPVDYWVICCGTGGTLAGMISALSSSQIALGIPVLKGGFLQNEIELLLKRYKNRRFGNWQLNTDYHFGGYAKWNKSLIRFINAFKKKHQIPLDPIYTGKLFYAIYDLMEKGYFRKGSTIVAVHTGGLQGIEGFNARFGNLIN